LGFFVYQGTKREVTWRDSTTVKKLCKLRIFEGGEHGTTPDSGTDVKGEPLHCKGDHQQKGERGTEKTQVFWGERREVQKKHWKKSREKGE